MPLAALAGWQSSAMAFAARPARPPVVVRYSPKRRKALRAFRAKGRGQKLVLWKFRALKERLIFLTINH